MDWRERNRTLAAVAGFRTVMTGVAAASGEPILMEAAWVTSEFFDVPVRRPGGRTSNAGAATGSSVQRSWADAGEMDKKRYSGAPPVP